CHGGDESILIDRRAVNDVREVQTRQVHAFARPLTEEDDGDAAGSGETRGGNGVGPVVVLDSNGRSLGPDGLERRGRVPDDLGPSGRTGIPFVERGTTPRIDLGGAAT